jgi:hypothetical protein
LRIEIIRVDGNENVKIQWQGTFLVLHWNDLNEINSLSVIYIYTVFVPS